MHRIASVYAITTTPKNACNSGNNVRRKPRTYIMTETNIIAALKEMPENTFFHDDGERISAFLPDQARNINNYSIIPVYKVPEGDNQLGKKLTFHLNNAHTEYLHNMFLCITLPELTLQSLIVRGYLPDNPRSGWLELSEIRNSYELERIVQSYNKEHTPRLKFDYVLFNQKASADRSDPLTGEQEKTLAAQLGKYGGYDVVYRALDAHIKGRYRRPGDVYRIRYVGNLGHRIIRNVTMFLDDIEYFTIDSFYLDIQMQQKRADCALYKQMIGHVPECYDPDNVTTGRLPAYKLIIPIVFPVCNGDSVLPLTLIDKTVKIEVSLCELEELLMIDVMSNLHNARWSQTSDEVSESTTEYMDDPFYPLNNGHRIQVWKYKSIPQKDKPFEPPHLNVSCYSPIAMAYFGRIVSIGDWREWLDGKPRAIQTMLNVNYVKVQENEKQWLLNVKNRDRIKYIATDWNMVQRYNVAGKKTRIPIRTKHLMKAIYFAVVNTTVKTESGQYATSNDKPIPVDNWRVTIDPSTSTNPIACVSLYYWKDARFYEVDASYFTHTVPFMHRTTRTQHNHIHMYAFNKDILSSALAGYANYEELDNVDLEITLTDEACEYMDTWSDHKQKTLPYRGVHTAQRYEIVVGYENYCILNYMDGSLDVMK